MSNSARIRQFLTLGFLLRLWLEKFAECRLRVARDNQDFLFRAGFVLFLFGFRHCFDGKLYTYRLGFKKVPRTGIEPVRLDKSPDCKSGLFANSSTGAQVQRRGVPLTDCSPPLGSGTSATPLIPPHGFLTSDPLILARDYTSPQRCFLIASSFISAAEVFGFFSLEAAMARTENYKPTFQQVPSPDIS